MSEMSATLRGAIRAHAHFVQAELVVSDPGDRHEQEAARVVNAVMRMPSPDNEETPAILPQRRFPRSNDCAPTTKTSLQKRAGRGSAKKETADAPSIPPSVGGEHTGASGGGSPRPVATRAFFERRFGVNFSNVRVHTL